LTKRRRKLKIIAILVFDATKQTDVGNITKALLTIMYSTKTLADLKLKGSPPNIKLHALKGNRKGEWSISLENGSPWRMTFRFDKGDFSNIKIEDYHD
jgi:plasmid maintenance system killer protein